MNTKLRGRASVVVMSDLEYVLSCYPIAKIIASFLSYDDICCVVQAYNRSTISSAELSLLARTAGRGVLRHNACYKVLPVVFSPYRTTADSLYDAQFYIGEAFKTRCSLRSKICPYDLTADALTDYNDIHYWENIISDDLHSGGHCNALLDFIDVLLEETCQLINTQCGLDNLVNHMVFQTNLELEEHRATFKHKTCLMNQHALPFIHVGLLTVYLQHDADQSELTKRLVDAILAANHYGLLDLVYSDHRTITIDLNVDPQSPYGKFDRTELTFNIRWICGHARLECLELFPNLTHPMYIEEQQIAISPVSWRFFNGNRSVKYVVASTDTPRYDWQRFAVLQYSLQRYPTHEIFELHFRKIIESSTDLPLEYFYQYLCAIPLDPMIDPPDSPRLEPLLVGLTNQPSACVLPTYRFSRADHNDLTTQFVPFNRIFRSMLATI
jgi:hypothetical protein